MGPIVNLLPPGNYQIPDKDINERQEHFSSPFRDMRQYYAREIKRVLLSLSSGNGSDYAFKLEFGR